MSFTEFSNYVHFFVGILILKVIMKMKVPGVGQGSTVAIQSQGAGDCGSTQKPVSKNFVLLDPGLDSQTDVSGCPKVIPQMMRQICPEAGGLIHLEDTGKENYLMEAKLCMLMIEYKLHYLIFSLFTILICMYEDPFDRIVGGLGDGDRRQIFQNFSLPVRRFALVSSFQCRSCIGHLNLKVMKQEINCFVFFLYF